MCKICNKIEIVNAIDVNSKEFIDKLWELFSLTPSQLSVYNPTIVNYIEEILQNETVENSVKIGKNKKNFDANIYNFSLFKTGNFIENIKNIKTYYKVDNQEQAFTSLVNTTMGSELSVEKYQVKHITETSKVFVDADKNELLTYYTRDNKARPSHMALGGTTMLKNDKRWNRIIKVLGEWNCRCAIFESEDNILRNPPKLEEYKEAYSISDVDVISGKVITFSERHPVFDTNLEVLRKQYKKQDW